MLLLGSLEMQTDHLIFIKKKKKNWAVPTAQEI